MPVKHLLPGLVPGVTCQSPECDLASGSPQGQRQLLLSVPMFPPAVPHSHMLDQNPWPAREALVSFSSAIKGEGGGMELGPHRLVFGGQFR